MFKKARKRSRGVRINLLKEQPEVTSKKVSVHSHTTEHVLLKPDGTKVPVAYSRPLSPEQVKIMKRIKAEGLLTERMLTPKRESGRTYVVARVLPSGDELKYVLLKNPKKTKELLEKAAEFLAKIHNLGIVHGHPHTSNFAVLEDGQVFLRQYSAATRTNIWNKPEPEKIFNAFKTDFYMFRTFSDELSRAEKDFFIKKVISKYPLDEETKRWLETKTFCKKH